MALNCSSLSKKNVKDDAEDDDDAMSKVVVVIPHVHVKIVLDLSTVTKPKH
jgi:hypothetical protein